MGVRRLVLMAMCITILFVQKQVFSFIPNVQFNVVLLLLYASVFKLRENVAIIVIYVILDNMFHASFHPLYSVPMLIGWLLIPFSYYTVLRRTTSEVKLAIFAFIFGFVYGWIFIPFKMFDLGISELWPYLVADLPFEIIMAVSSFLTVLWVFKPLHKILSTEISLLETSSRHGY